MLINSEKEFKDVIGTAQANLSWETLKPFVRLADLTYIVPAIGEELYDALSASKSPSISERKLIERLRIASGQYTYSLSLAQMIMAYGDNGVAQNVQGSMAPITKWSYVEAKKSATIAAERALEDALVFLETNNEDFTLYQPLTGCIITGATDFSLFFPAARNSRRLFLELKNYLIQIQNNDLNQAIGGEMLNILLTPLAYIGPAPIMAQALMYVKYYLAYATVSKAVPFLNINSEWRVVSESSLMNVQDENSLDQFRRNEIKIVADNEAEKYLNLLRAYCDKVASTTVFPTYFNSAMYQSNVANKPYERHMNEVGKPWVLL
jgi:hypothetical protein